ncbi:uncharacterized protein LOC127448461 isoform X2 [Myxocyprinus asiaticus]|uniref:uncharacterized protein LOC127448461 isoform X2 n=1 Tax=Myxocyprinus asiaticus TaxID=70543 RepID=UPI002221F0DC|nr:uncharacterized protein LOC127448461 isoform X2 [Myxocyprinus asiaticus]
MLSSSSSAEVVTGDGPTLIRSINKEHQLQDEQCKEAISLMTHTNDRETIFQKMRETFEYRQRLVHNPGRSATVLSVFPRLLDTKGLILQDFSLLFGPEISARLLEWWPSYKPKLIKEASALVSTPYLEQLLQSARQEQGESSVDSSKAGRKRTNKISARQAMDHLVDFHKSCRSLEEHLDVDEHRQPYLLASRTSRRAINSFYTVMDKKLISCQGSTSLAAFDEHFKVHFVFS